MRDSPNGHGRSHSDAISSRRQDVATGPRVDAELHPWARVSEAGDWKGLLLGNGASRALWDAFGYPSLFAVAHDPERSHPLSAEDRELFEQFRTKNFEEVLSNLAIAARVNGILGVSADECDARYASIRQALVGAVHHVHVPCSFVPDETLLAIRGALRAHSVVFTTNYDLITYWAIMAAERGEGFKDYIWPIFDLTDTEIWDDATRVLFLHGALHIERTSDGTTRKLIADSQNLLRQFAARPDAVPLFVTEGDWRRKVAAIARSDYLTFAYTEFHEHGDSLVVFGHSLAERYDDHLVRAMRIWGDVRIAIAMLPAEPRSIIRMKASLHERLPQAELHFFNALTHPLGMLPPASPFEPIV